LTYIINLLEYNVIIILYNLYIIYKPDIQDAYVNFETRTVTSTYYFDIFLDKNYHCEDGKCIPQNTSMHFL